MLAFSFHHCTHCHLSWPERFSLFNFRTFCLRPKSQSYLQSRHLFFPLFFFLSATLYFKRLRPSLSDRQYNQDATKNAGIYINDNNDTCIPFSISISWMIRDRSSLRSQITHKHGIRKIFRHSPIIGLSSSLTIVERGCYG